MMIRFDLIIVAPNGDAWLVDLEGQRGRAERLRDRKLEEALAVEAIKRRATPPRECGPDIPVAPARGPMATFQPRRTEMTGSGPRTHADGYLGRRGARRADAFDLMTEQARKAYAKKIAGLPVEEAPAFKAPFSIGQVQMARE